SQKVAQAYAQQHRRQEPDSKSVRVQETTVKCKRRAALLPTRQHHEQEQNTLQKRSKGKPSLCCKALHFTNDSSFEVDIGRIDIKCHYCGALYFQEEQTGGDLNQFISCCHKGAVVLPLFLNFMMC
ncbi:835_t:CDS:1, partial [Dentiscutata erythropus]